MRGIRLNIAVGSVATQALCAAFKAANEAENQGAGYRHIPTSGPEFQQLAKWVAVEVLAAAASKALVTQSLPARVSQPKAFVLISADGAVRVATCSFVGGHAIVGLPVDMPATPFVLKTLTEDIAAVVAGAPIKVACAVSQTMLTDMCASL
jgi:hypothetical protein